MQAAQADQVEQLLAEKRYVEAGNMLQEQLYAQPDNDDLRLRLAQVLSWAGNYREAEGHFIKILLHQPRYFDVALAYARMLSWQQHYHEAIEQMESFFQSDFRLQAHYWVGKFYEEAGNFWLARKHYRLAGTVPAKEYPLWANIHVRSGVYEVKNRDHWNFQKFCAQWQPHRKWGLGVCGERWERYRKQDYRWGLLANATPQTWVSVSVETHFCEHPSDFLPEQYYYGNAYWNLGGSIPVSLLTGVSRSFFGHTDNTIYSFGLESYFYGNFYGGYRFFWVFDSFENESEAHQWYGGWNVPEQGKVFVSFSRGNEIVDALYLQDHIISSWHGLIEVERRFHRCFSGLLHLGYFEDENAQYRWEYELGCQVYF